MEHNWAFIFAERAGRVSTEAFGGAFVSALLAGDCGGGAVPSLDVLRVDRLGGLIYELIRGLNMRDISAVFVDHF
jgi:hypothetical protein